MQNFAGFKPSPLEDSEYFPYGFDAFRPGSQRANPNSGTQINFDQTAPFTAPTYNPYMQLPWALCGHNSSVPDTAQHSNVSETHWDRDDTCMEELEKAAKCSTSCPESSKVESRQHVRTSLPVEQPSKGKKHPASRSRCAVFKAKSGTIGQSACRWEGCTSTRLYSHNTSLWRHIKEKHLFPSAFKCPAPHCDRAFGRNDKLSEHWKSVHPETQGPRQGRCDSCNAECQVECYA